MSEVQGLLELPAPARARRTDPPTSHEAAESVDVTDLEARVLRALLMWADGLTTHELADRLCLSLVTVSPRMRPLVNKGKVLDSGRKRTGSSSRKSIVWVAA